MKNSKIYFVSAPRGMWCDFISYQISLDDNYYTLPLVNHNGLNKWNVGSALTHWHDGITFDLKAAVFPEEAIAASERSWEILSQYTEKHYVVQSHYCKDSTALHIPNIVPIRITCDPYYYPFFFMLGVLKVFLDPTGLAGNKPSLFFVCNKMKMNDPFLVIETLWARDFVNTMYDPAGYTELDVSKLFQDRLEFDRWGDVFDMCSPLDVKRFEQKWADDFKLIERKFGMKYEDLVKTNWMEAIHKMTYEIIEPLYPLNKDLLNHFYNRSFKRLAKR